MSVSNNFGIRLQQARKMAGLSLNGLAERMQGSLTRQSLHKYEKGMMMPDSDKLIALANALDVTVNFFFREATLELKGMEFRKHSRMPVKESDAIIGTIKDHMSRYLEVERLLASEKKFKNPLGKEEIIDPAHAEHLAVEVRRKWKLGMDAIPSVYETLEQQAIKVIECKGSRKFDGLNTRVNGHMVIVVNDDGDVVRRRFTAAHELGHALLNIPENIEHKLKEKICHRFAGAFLFPEKQFRDRVGVNRDRFYMGEMVDWKRTWGISILAMIMRSRDLGIINSVVHKRMLIGYNSSGYRKNEPGEYPVEEKTVRFQHLVLAGLAQNFLSINQAAEFLNMKVGAFRRAYPEAL